MRRCRYLWCVRSLLFMMFGPVCFSQTLTIRVVKASDNRPLVKEKVSIFSTGQSKLTAKLTTDMNGEVQVEVPSPAPAFILVQVMLDEGHCYYPCSAWIAPQEAIRSGYVNTSTTEAKKNEMNPKPREILFRIRSKPWWVRLLSPLERE
jgi:hypothetical protein